MKFFQVFLCVWALFTAQVVTHQLVPRKEKDHSNVDLDMKGIREAAYQVAYTLGKQTRDRILLRDEDWGVYCLLDDDCRAALSDVPASSAQRAIQMESQFNDPGCGNKCVFEHIRKVALLAGEDAFVRTWMMKDNAGRSIAKPRFEPDAWALNVMGTLKKGLKDGGIDGGALKKALKAGRTWDVDIDQPQQPATMPASSSSPNDEEKARFRSGNWTGNDQVKLPSHAFPTRNQTTMLSNGTSRADRTISPAEVLSDPGVSPSRLLSKGPLFLEQLFAFSICRDHSYLCPPNDAEHIDSLDHVWPIISLLHAGIQDKVLHADDPVRIALVRVEEAYSTEGETVLFPDELKVGGKWLDQAEKMRSEVLTHASLQKQAAEVISSDAVYATEHYEEDLGQLVMRTHMPDFDGEGAPLDPGLRALGYVRSSQIGEHGEVEQHRKLVRLAGDFRSIMAGSWAVIPMPAGSQSETESAGASRQALPKGDKVATKDLESHGSTAVLRRDDRRSGSIQKHHARQEGPSLSSRLNSTRGGPVEDDVDASVFLGPAAGRSQVNLATVLFWGPSRVVASMNRASQSGNSTSALLHARSVSGGSNDPDQLHFCLAGDVCRWLTRDLYHAGVREHLHTCEADKCELNSRRIGENSDQEYLEKLKVAYPATSNGALRTPGHDGPTADDFLGLSGHGGRTADDFLGLIPQGKDALQARDTDKVTDSGARRSPQAWETPSIKNARTPLLRRVPKLSGVGETNGAGNGPTGSQVFQALQEPGSTNQAVDSVGNPILRAVPVVDRTPAGVPKMLSAAAVPMFLRHNINHMSVKVFSATGKLLMGSRAGRQITSGAFATGGFAVQGLKFVTGLGIARFVDWAATTATEFYVGGAGLISLALIPMMVGLAEGVAVVGIALDIGFRMVHMFSPDKSCPRPPYRTQLWNEQVQSARTIISPCTPSPKPFDHAKRSAMEALATSGTDTLTTVKKYTTESIAFQTPTSSPPPPTDPAVPPPSVPSASVPILEAPSPPQPTCPAPVPTARHARIPAGPAAQPDQRFPHRTSPSDHNVCHTSPLQPGYVWVQAGDLLCPVQTPIECTNHWFHQRVDDLPAGVRNPNYCAMGDMTGHFRAKDMDCLSGDMEQYVDEGVERVKHPEDFKSKKCKKAFGLDHEMKPKDEQK